MKLKDILIAIGVVLVLAAGFYAMWALAAIIVVIVISYAIPAIRHAKKEVKKWK